MELIQLHAKLVNTVMALRPQFMAIPALYLPFQIVLVWKLMANAIFASNIDTVHDLVCQKLTSLNVLLVMTVPVSSEMISQIEMTQSVQLVITVSSHSLPLTVLLTIILTELELQNKRTVMLALQEKIAARKQESISHLIA